MDCAKRAMAVAVMAGGLVIASASADADGPAGSQRAGGEGRPSWSRGVGGGSGYFGGPGATNSSSEQRSFYTPWTGPGFGNPDSSAADVSTGRSAAGAYDASGAPAYSKKGSTPSAARVSHAKKAHASASTQRSTHNSRTATPVQEKR